MGKKVRGYSLPNAGRQPLGRAGATKERTLFPVGWTPLLGAGCESSILLSLIDPVLPNQLSAVETKNL